MYLRKVCITPAGGMDQMIEPALRTCMVPTSKRTQEVSDSEEGTVHKVKVCSAGYIFLEYVFRKFAEIFFVICRATSTTKEKMSSL